MFWSQLGSWSKTKYTPEMNCNRIAIGVTIAEAVRGIPHKAGNG